MKSFTRFSKASGSDKRRVADLANGSGRYSPRLTAKRKAAQERRLSRLEAGESVQA